ncbi:MAG: hypothetical protein KTR26_08055 [Flammeovirgaceae bacterium]|nr:hypothetical protein [Flammeovirgaceae bacterium]
MKMKYWVILFVTILLSPTTFGQNNQKIAWHKTFAKAYGYVKYFHPSDENEKIDWGKFAIYGANEIEKCKTEKEFFTTLNKLFLPMAPSVKFIHEREKRVFDNQAITPKNPNPEQITFWQHKGLAYGMEHLSGEYKSVRVNRVQKQTHSSSGFGYITACISARKLKGKTIKYSGWIKVKEGREKCGSLFIRADKANRKVVFFNNAYTDNNSEWTRYEVTGIIDEDAIGICLGCTFAGKGQLMVDQLQLFYQEDEKWIEVPIPNGNFETEEILAPSKDTSRKLVYFGKDYKIARTSKTPFEGNYCGELKSIEKETVKKQPKIFNHQPKFGEIIEEKIGENIYCQIPLVLFFNKEGTFPKANSKKLKKLNIELEKCQTTPENLATRLGNIINVYNVFHHFYPYFEEVEGDWDKAFEKALSWSYSDQSERDHLITLQKFTAGLKDGHIQINSKTREEFAPGFNWEIIENELVITKILDETIPLKNGEIVTQINGIPKKDYLSEIRSRISAGTIDLIDFKNAKMSLVGEENSEISIITQKHELKLKRTVNYAEIEKLSLFKKNSWEVIDDSIFYLNLDVLSMDSIRQLLPQIESSKAIICDIRFRPNNNHEFLSHLIKPGDSANFKMQIPQFVYPDQKQLEGYFGDTTTLHGKAPYLRNKKIIFITQGSAISYAETYLGFIKDYKLGTIIGQPTGGANGTVNMFKLPGGYSIFWTGAKVMKGDGSPLYGIGISPDINIYKTIKGTSEEKDEFLEQAIKMAKDKDLKIN